jgi:dienelactone hydrolase
LIKALQPDLTVAEERESDISPENDPLHVSRLVALPDGNVVCVFSACEEDSDTRVFLLADDGSHTPIPGLKDIDGVWPAQDDLLVLADRTVSLVARDGTASSVVDVPEHTLSIEAVWLDDGIRVVAIVRGDREEGPELLPKERDRDTLNVYAPSTGWRKVVEVPNGVSSLSLSGDGSRCAWRESVNTVPEEAMRGEFRACEIQTGEVTSLTEGAGKAWWIRVAPDGSGVAYQANFQKDRPITTHTDVWWQPWGTSEPIRMTLRGRNVEDFGWLDASTLWVTYIEGVVRFTETVGLDGTVTQLSHPAMDEVVRWQSEKTVCVSGSADRFPYLAIGSAEVEITDMSSLNDLKIRTVDWTASDDLPIQGIVYETNETPDGAPLIVKAHGGPAGDVEAMRAGAIRQRYLLRAGYRVLEPAFRGSLGYGDDFLGANIGCQGDKDLDDIVMGVDKLVEMGIADPNRVGITGGSYGGYMTIRAVAATDRFKTGVALYGFMSNRLMTLETGDFTYENEYIAPVTWPLTNEAEGSDVFSQLHEINCPLLLLHGEQDTICPVSQSRMIYRALEHRGVSAGLVVYPGEGHGFWKKAHRQDCARRTLVWFEEFLPV